MTTQRTPRLDSARAARAVEFKRRLAATGLRPTEFAKRAGITRNVYYNLSIGQEPKPEQRDRVEACSRNTACSNAEGKRTLMQSKNQWAPRASGSTYGAAQKEGPSMPDDLSRLGYREIAERYDLGSVKFGGDLQITDGGDLKTTRDGDLQLGNDQHNALHRLVVRWQFNAPMLKTMLDFVSDAEAKMRAAKTELENVSAMMSAEHEAAIDMWHDLHQEIGIHEYGPEAYAGTTMVVLSGLLRREWADLGKPSVWDTAGTKIKNRSVGVIVEAAAHNFRHSDEWSTAVTPTEQQLKSILVIADVLDARLEPRGKNHPFRGNVCPEILHVVSESSFETLMDRFFRYARALAGL